MQTRLLVHELGTMSLTIETLSGTSDKESARLMDPIQSSKVQITAVEQISGSGFPDQVVHDPRIVDSAAGDNHYSWNVAAQVKQRMKLHRGFAATKLSPRKKGQTQIDNGRVERVDTLLQFQTKRFIRVQLTGQSNIGTLLIRNPRFRIGHGLTVVWSNLRFRI